jgi:hypothetical protein
VRNREVWASYDAYTLELTRHARQVAFGGVAIAWVLRAADERLPGLVLVAMALLCIFFLLDVAQYSVAAWKLRRWAHGEEQRQYDVTGSIDGEYELPRSLDLWPARLLALKIAALLLGYVMLALTIFRRSA